MSDLGIIDLYEKSNKSNSKEFLEKIDSKLSVKTDIKKLVSDTEWMEIIETTIPYIDNIFRSPNRFIVNEEEILKIEQTKKIGVETIKHLSKNTNLIQTLDEKTGDVIPSKLLNVRKEESYDTYENRLIYTLVQKTRMFLKKRKEALENIENNKTDEDSKDDKSFEYVAKTELKNEKIDINVSLNSTLENEKVDKSEIGEILKIIDNLENRLNDFDSLEVYRIIDKLNISLVREPIKKTNVVKKNVNFQYAMKLWDYLRDHYDDSSDEINDKQDYEDNGELKSLVDETFMLQYLIMKTLDQDKEENETTNEEIKEMIIEQMIDKVMDMNVSVNDEDIKQMIATKYEVIKYKKTEFIQEIQKIYKKHFETYLESVEKRRK